jgi:parallel beta-helix repeat protein
MIAFISFFSPVLADDSKIIFSADTVIAASVTIPEGTTCIIKPGVRIFIEGYQSITVRGLIIAEGTRNKPIIFTSVDRPTGSREPPTWKGIEIAGKAANGRFTHCRFEGAFRNLIWECNPSFDSCTFSGNHYGLYCAKKASPHISHCMINLNAYGVAADFAYPLLLGNMITQNVIGLYLQLSSEAIAGKNTIEGNEINIRVENAFGKNAEPSSLQSIWDIMKQLY